MWADCGFGNWTAGVPFNAVFNAVPEAEDVVRCTLLGYTCLVSTHVPWWFVVVGFVLGVFIGPLVDLIAILRGQVVRVEHRRPATGSGWQYHPG